MLDGGLGDVYLYHVSSSFQACSPRSSALMERAFFIFAASEFPLFCLIFSPYANRSLAAAGVKLLIIASGFSLFPPVFESFAV